MPAAVIAVIAVAAATLYAHSVLGQKASQIHTQRFFNLKELHPSGTSNTTITSLASFFFSQADKSRTTAEWTELSARSTASDFSTAAGGITLPCWPQQPSDKRVYLIHTLINNAPHFLHLRASGGEYHSSGLLCVCVCVLG